MARSFLLPGFVAALMGAGVAQAQGQRAAPAAPSLLVYGVAGTGGVGLGLGYPLNDKLVLRAELARATWSHDTSKDAIDYAGRVKLGTAALLADYHPWSGSLRVTAGLEFGMPRADLSALTHGSTLVVNNRSYEVPAGEGLSATVRYPSVMPYLGVGWGYGKAGRPGLQFGIDVGAAIGRARGSLSATQGLRSLPGFEADLAVQNSKFADEAARLKLFPTVKLGIGYAF